MRPGWPRKRTPPLRTRKANGIDLAFTLPADHVVDPFLFRLVFMAGAAANATQTGVVEKVSARADLSRTVLFGGMNTDIEGVRAPQP